GAPVRVGEIPQHRVTQMTCQCRVLVDQPFGGLALVAHHDHVIHRLGRVLTFAATVDTKTITTKAELGDMPPAISEKLADPDRARDDLVPAIRPTALG